MLSLLYQKATLQQVHEVLKPPIKIVNSSAFLNLTPECLDSQRMETLEERCEICSKLTIKIPERRHRSGVFIFSFEHILHLSSSVSIVDFEQVNVSWDDIFILNFELIQYSDIFDWAKHFSF